MRSTSMLVMPGAAVAAAVAVSTASLDEVAEWMRKSSSPESVRIASWKVESALFRLP